MAISSSVRKAGPYVGNDATTVFPFAFKVFTAADVRVVRTSLAGIETDWTLDTEYAVTLNADQDNDPGGYVTATTALPAAELLTLTSNLDITQPLVLTSNGGFYPRVINNAFDRITIIAQQIYETLGRAIKLPISSTADPTLPTPAPNEVIAWNSTGDGFVNINLGDLATVSGYADARVEVYAGTGAQTAFTIDFNPGVLANLDVSVGGVTQTAGVDFTWAGTTVTFTTAPPDATTVQIRYARPLVPVPDFDAVMSSVADAEDAATRAELATLLDIATAQAATIPAAVVKLRTNFYTAASQVGGAAYRRVSKATIDSAGYSALAYFRSTDRFMPDGSTHATNGGYWLIDEVTPNVLQFGANNANNAAVDSAAAFDALFTVSNTGIVPDGVYYCSKMGWMLGAGRRLVGQSMWGAHIKAHSSMVDGEAILRNSASATGSSSYCYVYGVKLDTNGKDVVCIDAAQLDSCQFVGVLFLGSGLAGARKGTGIEYRAPRDESAYNNIAQFCHFEGLKRGIKAYQAANNNGAAHSRLINCDVGIETDKGAGALDTFTTVNVRFEGCGKDIVDNASKSRHVALRCENATTTSIELLAGSNGFYVDAGSACSATATPTTIHASATNVQILSQDFGHRDQRSSASNPKFDSGTIVRTVAGAANPVPAFPAGLGATDVHFGNLVLANGGADGTTALNFLNAAATNYLLGWFADNNNALVLSGYNFGTGGYANIRIGAGTEVTAYALNVNLGSGAIPWGALFVKQDGTIWIGDSRILAGAAHPEGAVVAAAGSLYMRQGSGVRDAVFIKTDSSGSAMTGWKPIGKENYAAALTPAAVAAATSAEQTFAVAGLLTTDRVVVNGPAPTAGTGIVGVRVSAADTLAITFANFTAGALTPAAGTYQVLAFPTV